VALFLHTSGTTARPKVNTNITQTWLSLWYKLTVLVLRMIWPLLFYAVQPGSAAHPRQLDSQYE
jgi:acyl-coenzyme A synthetase/AMP-(fatty) acid ligase